MARGKKLMEDTDMIKRAAEMAREVEVSSKVVSDDTIIGII